jgi:hypothetical protein
MSKTTVSIEIEYSNKIDELSILFGMNKITFMHAMVDYFDFYKISPLERKESLDIKLNKIETNLESKINKVRDTFVSFQRELEKKKLEPLIQQSNESTQALMVFLKEQALTKDDLKNLGSIGGRRVAAFEKQEVNTQQTRETLQREPVPTDEIAKYKQKANSSLKFYKTYFSELIKCVSRTSEKGDYILISSINEFKEKVKSIPKVTFEGPKNAETYEVIDHVETILRTVDNYCDSFLEQGQMAAGKDKLFYIHTIREYQSKFENIKIL